MASPMGIHIDAMPSCRHKAFASRAGGGVASRAEINVMQRECKSAKTKV
jgi:hypothetical protein